MKLAEASGMAYPRKLVKQMMDLIADEDETAEKIKPPEDMVVWLTEFHTRLAERLHRGEDVLDLIPE